ncbi:hypothetical protein, partial [Bradyrhizobium sp. AUGA SZCCT0283]|uniref:hypothetical protein n=1 Tax=Bradyrhizobium sp. AUGA SZCCT0283 TaxID=2807671 RepID=UPI001BADC70C
AYAQSYAYVFTTTSFQARRPSPEEYQKNCSMAFSLTAQRSICCSDRRQAAAPRQSPYRLEGCVEAMRHMVNENEVAVTGLFAINPAKENRYR